MGTKRWKVTIIMDIEENSHPSDFVPDCLNEIMKTSVGYNCDNEDIIDYEYETVSDDFELLSTINEEI